MKNSAPPVITTMALWQLINSYISCMSCYKAIVAIQQVLEISLFYQETTCFEDFARILYFRWLHVTLKFSRISPDLNIILNHAKVRVGGCFP